MKIITRISGIGFSITEFAEYLDISRPTLYKYCDDFDGKEIDKIPNKILKILKQIKENKFIGKNYIIKHLIETSCLNFEQKEINIFGTLDNFGYLFSKDEKKFIWRYINDLDFRIEIKEKLNEK